MAPRTRKRSSDPEASVRPTPRRKKASPDRSRSARPSRSARFRQSTLTQIVPEVSFLSRGSAAEHSEEEDEERERRPTKRRRRRIGPSQKTLTQIGWINPLRVPYNYEDEDDEGEGDGHVEEMGFESEVLPSDDDEYDQVIAVEENEVEDNAEEGVYGFSDDGEIYQEPEDVNRGPLGIVVQDTPHTPRRHRRREIPSSQTPPATPLTPWSVLRKRMKHNERSPLKAVSTNSKEERQDRADMPPPKLNSPLKRRSVRIAAEESTIIRPPLSERTHVSDSQDLSEPEEEEPNTTSPRGAAIGEETQAMIHRIDAACGPDLQWEKLPSDDGDTPHQQSQSGNSSQANGSFNFDDAEDAGAAPDGDEMQVPSPTPARKSPILGGDEDKEVEGEVEEQVEEEVGGEVENQVDEEEEEEGEDEDSDDEFPSSFPTPRAPPPTQASPLPTQTQEHSSQPFALQHPSQVSTVAETTQATPPRPTPRPATRQSRSQRTQTQAQTQTQPTPRQRARSTRTPASKTRATSRARSPSQATPADEPTQSPAHKTLQSQHDRDRDRIPESPIHPAAHHASSSATATPASRNGRVRRNAAPAPVPSSPLPPPPPHVFSSSPVVASPVRHGEGAGGADGYGYGYGYGHGYVDGSGSIDRVISATQLLPASLMDYSLPRPPVGWDAASEVGWVRSSMPEEVEDGDDGEEG
ncbi:hypothetical protein HDK64DRAFT_269793 [Phyllosticta capitalensis]